VSDTRPRSAGRLIVGLVLLTLGFLWTLDNLGVLDAHDVLRWWPIILVAVGATKLVRGGTSRIISGFLFVTAGMLLILRELDVIRFRIWELWPVFLMMIGAVVVLRSLRGEKAEAPDSPGEDGINVFAMMGAVVRKSAVPAFRGGEVTAVMAGADIDLRKARIADGQAVIDVFTWWGGIDLYVPEDWQVVSEATPIMGSFEDKTTGVKSATAPRLVVRGLIVMGGVEVKN
jgi:predicted membrane protein